MPQVVTLITDLMFSTKIQHTARELGLSATTIREPDQIRELLDAGDVKLVMADMSIGIGPAAKVLREASAHSSKPTALAFYSHVQAELREAAAEAGADVILPRSKFNTQLPHILAEHCQSSD
jgi:DNA-binding NarL/FixJ family response regulator